MASADGPKRTPLHRCHVQAGARLVDFAGWEMPVSYSGILAEHLAVRRAAGLFDVSHMGEIQIEARAPSRSSTRSRPTAYAASCPAARSTARSSPRKAPTSTTCWCTVSMRRPSCWSSMPPTPPRISPGSARATTDGVTIDDVSDATALLALQGPRSSEILARCHRGGSRLAAFLSPGVDHGGRRAGGDLAHRLHRRGRLRDLRRPRGRRAGVDDPARRRARAAGSCPSGLGARDSLRLEAGLCLYGHEIDETVTPFEVGLDWVVKLEDRDFVGRDALLRQRAAGVPRRLVGLELDGPAHRSRRGDRMERRAKRSAGSPAAPGARISSSRSRWRWSAPGTLRRGRRSKWKCESAKERAVARGLPFYRRRSVSDCRRCDSRPRRSEGVDVS